MLLTSNFPISLHVLWLTRKSVACLQDDLYEHLANFSKSKLHTAAAVDKHRWKTITILFNDMLRTCMNFVFYITDYFNSVRLPTYIRKAIVSHCQLLMCLSPLNLQGWHINPFWSTIIHNARLLSIIFLDNRLSSYRHLGSKGVTYLVISTHHCQCAHGKLCIRMVKNQGGFTNVWRALQNILSKFVYCGNSTCYANFKLKLCTCA